MAHMLQGDTLYIKCMWKLASPGNTLIFGVLTVLLAIWIQTGNVRHMRSNSYVLYRFFTVFGNVSMFMYNWIKINL